MPSRLAALALAALLATLMAADVHAAESHLTGRWMLNHELTREVQPDDPAQRDLLGNLPRTSVSVGGIPLPRTGGDELPRAGSGRDPTVLHSASLAISEADDDRLRLVYDGGQSDTLERGNDQGLVSRWSARKLTTRYQTTSRTVSQVYELRRDGTLLVTVKLNPKQGPTLVHKRVFERGDAAGDAGAADAGAADR
jgi:hypothetical protein